MRDEQKGFLKDYRFCIDHMSTLNNVTQNNDSTFVTFKELQKSLDSVNRESL